MERKRLARCGLGVLLTLASLVPAVAAQAEGTYTVYTCRADDWAVQEPAPATDWGVAFPPKSTVDTFGSACPGGPISLEMSGSASHPFDDFVHMTFAAPPDTQIQDYVLWRSVQLASTYNYRYWENYGDGTSAELDTCFTSQGCTSKGSAGTPDSAANKVCGGTICPRGHSDITSLMISLTCSVSSGSCPAASPGARFQLHRADVRLVDRLDPLLTGPPTGALASGGTSLAGVQKLTVSGSDRGGGVYEALIVVDGNVQHAPLDANGGLCGRPFMAAVPCKLSVSGTVDVDTTQLADGKHTLKVMVSDVAGNLSGAWGPVEFTTANASCNPEPRVGGMTMHAGIVTRKGKLRRAVTTRVGRKVKLRGQLVNTQGQAVAGAPVCLAVRDDRAGASAVPAGAATTDAHGRVALTLPPGPSRVVYLVYRVPGGAIAASTHVRVRAAVKLRATRSTLRNGASLQLRGRLRAGRRAGVLVELQAHRDSGWQTFGTTRTGRGGRFGYRYQFTRTTGVQHYALRARIPKQASYPFVAGGSRRVTVTVRG